MVRNSPIALIFRFNRPATARLMRIVGTTVPAVKTTVLRIAIANSGSDGEQLGEVLAGRRISAGRTGPSLENSCTARSRAGTSMNTRDRGQVGCDEHAPGPRAPRCLDARRRPVVGQWSRRWRSWVAQHLVDTVRQLPFNDVAGRDPRNTGPKLRSIKALTFSHSAVTGKPSELAGPPVSTRQIVDSVVRSGETPEVSADCTTGTKRPDSPISACPTGPAANFTNSQACCLRRLLAAMARPVVPMFDRAR